MLQLEKDDFDIAQEEPKDVQEMNPEQFQIERRIREQQNEQRTRDNDDIDNDVLYGQFYNNSSHKGTPPNTNIAQLQP